MEMAAGVITAKARSMLGEQLSAQDYEELQMCIRDSSSAICCKYA